MTEDKPKRKRAPGAGRKAKGGAARIKPAWSIDPALVDAINALAQQKGWTKNDAANHVISLGITQL